MYILSVNFSFFFLHIENHSKERCSKFNIFVVVLLSFNANMLSYIRITCVEFYM